MSKEAIAAIASTFSASEVWEVTSFRAYTESREIVVELYDSHVPGPHRYMARAYDPSIPEDQRDINSNGHTQGNPAGSITDAVANIHACIFKEN